MPKLLLSLFVFVDYWICSVNEAEGVTKKSVTRGFKRTGPTEGDKTQGYILLVCDWQTTTPHHSFCDKGTLPHNVIKLFILPATDFMAEDDNSRVPIPEPEFDDNSLIALTTHEGGIVLNPTWLSPKIFDPGPFRIRFATCPTPVPAPLPPPK